MPPDDFNQMLNIDIQSMNISLMAKASRSVLSLEEFIRISLLNGASKNEIRDELLRDLNEGGRIFGEFRNSIRATSNGIINRLRDTAQFSQDYKVKEYRWVAVFINTCPDCMERHGEVGTLGYWEKKGLPRSGFTVCKDYCKCVLIDADTTILEPIKRPRG